MNIRYTQNNLLKMSHDNLINFLYDIIFQDFQDVENYQTGIVYRKGDKVYLQENDKHQVFRCIVNESSLTFVSSQWEHVMDFFDGNVERHYNLVVKEEVHYINEDNKDGVYTNLEFKFNQSTVALYCGKKRYAINHDFVIIDNYIKFKKPFNVGDRIIFEVREQIGSFLSIGIVLYDLDAQPYKVYINSNKTATIEKIDKYSEDDVKYAEFATGDRTYTLLVDGGSIPYELKAYRNIETYITGTDDKMYKVEAEGEKLSLIETDRGDCFSDTKIIMGIDKKFYTLAVVKGKIIATEHIDDTLDINNFEFGVRFITKEFYNRTICIDNGVVTIKPYNDNGGYHNINFIDQVTKKIVRLSATEDNSLELNDGIATDGSSGTRMLDYFHFFDNEWTPHRMFVRDGLLMFENCGLDVIPDSRGINLLKKDGEMVKLRIPNQGEDIHLIKCVSLHNLGTFASPIEGFVMSLEGETKLVTINKETNGFEIVDTDLPFRTNHHYVLSRDNKLYKLVVNGNNVTFVEGDYNDIDFVHFTEEYVLEYRAIGAFIMSNKMITRFDIIDGEMVFNPISTFVHRIKSETGEAFLMDVSGKPYEEILQFKNVNDVDFETEVGYGNLYLKDVDGDYFIANIDRNGNISIKSNNVVDDVDYEITSLFYTSKGLYKIILDKGDILLEKMFDNLYENNLLSYGNIIKKDFEMQGVNGRWYSLSANGLGEVIIKERDTNVYATGLLLRSDDGYNYGLGISNGDFIIYRSYITNIHVPREIYVKDSITGETHVLFMSGQDLYSDISSKYTDNTEIIMCDAYQNQFKLEMQNNKLFLSAL